MPPTDGPTAGRADRSGSARPRAARGWSADRDLRTELGGGRHRRPRAPHRRRCCCSFPPSCELLVRALDLADPRAAQHRPLPGDHRPARPGDAAALARRRRDGRGRRVRKRRAAGRPCRPAARSGSHGARPGVDRRRVGRRARTGEPARDDVVPGATRQTAGRHRVDRRIPRQLPRHRQPPDLGVRARPTTRGDPFPRGQMLDGDTARATRLLRTGGWAVVSQALARQLGLHVGDRFLLPSPESDPTARLGPLDQHGVAARRDRHQRRRLCARVGKRRRERPERDARAGDLARGGPAAAARSPRSAHGTRRQDGRRPPSGRSTRAAGRVLHG